jgi:hypothetical protein
LFGHRAVARAGKESREGNLDLTAIDGTPFCQCNLPEVGDEIVMNRSNDEIGVNYSYDLFAGVGST